MKKDTKYIVLIIFLLQSIVYYAQSVGTYAVTRTTGISYSSISSSGNAFGSWRYSGGFSQDDNRSDFTDIGFDFWYAGVRYTQFCVSTNGYLDFSTSTDDGGPQADDFGYNNTAFTASAVGSATRPALAVFYDDLMAQGGTEPLGNSIKYLVSGSAPNRVLTVEWINMATYGNTTPSLNFQIKLYETTGIIEFIYGTMTAGTQSWSYTCGINNTTMGNPPTAVQLLSQQTENTATFSNAVKNNLSAMVANDSKITFTPPTPANPGSTLTFSGVGQTGMTLNWTNWASNEVGYVIYNSTDGANYNFVTQTAVNATNAAITGLLPGTLYYWRLYAVTDGCLSNAVSGLQATAAAGNKTSTKTGSWNDATAWSPAGIPTAADNVTIISTHTITINTNVTCNNLTVGQGAAAMLRIGDNNTTRTIQINNNLSVTANATFNVNAASNTSHALSVKGNVTNNGVFNMATDGNSLCNVTFTKEGDQTISGSGGTTNFNLLTLNMGTGSNNILEITSSAFSAASNFLTLTNGILKFSTINAVNVTPFANATTIGIKAGLWLNSANVTVSTGNSITLYGQITVDNGTFNIGNAANEDLLTRGGILTINGGALNIAGKYYTDDINNIATFNLTGGIVTLPVSASTSTTIAPFDISGVGSVFNMSAGTIVIRREGGNGGQNLGYVNTGGSGGSVTGGNLQIGDGSTPAGQTININSTSYVGNLLVNSANATASLLTNSLSIFNNVVISAGTLDANNLDISLGGDWTNGGIFTPGTGTVTFNSNSSQTITKAGGETFNHLVFSGTGTKLLGDNVTTNGNLTINSSSILDVSASNYTVDVNGNWVNDGTFTRRNGTVTFSGTSSQTVGGAIATTFYNLTLDNAAGASLSSSQNIEATLQLNNGTLTTNGNLTLLSGATNTGRIGAIAGGADISGDVIIQRFAPGGKTGWAMIGAPISTALTLSSWDDDIYISCSSCPDGSAGGFTSIYTYDETVAGPYTGPASYVPITDISNAITSGVGYYVYLGTGSSTTTDITIDVTGNISKFNQSLPLSYTNTGSAIDDGWNMIANPYPSPVRWSSLHAGNPNVEDAIYCWNADLSAGAGAFASYVGGVSNPAIGSGGIGDTIPMGQGFFVHATSAATLTATESIKTVGNPTFLKNGNPVSVTSGVGRVFRLFLDGPNNYHDETAFHFNSSASNLFDANFDAYKLFGMDTMIPSIASQVNGALFSINGLPDLTGNTSVEVKVKTGVTGTFTISPFDIDELPMGACVTLYDKFTGITTDLRSSGYQFLLSDTTNSARFILSITVAPLAVTSNIQQPNCSNQPVAILAAIGNNNGPWNYYWKNKQGSIVKTSLNKITADTLLTNIAGDYILEINTVGLCDNGEVLFNVNSAGISPMAHFELSNDTTYIFYGGAVNCINNSQYALNYTWDFGDGSGTSGVAEPVHIYSNPGMYNITLIAFNASGCSDTISRNVLVLSYPTSVSEGKEEEVVAYIVRSASGQQDLYISGIAMQSENINVSCFDITGKQIFTESLNVQVSGTINLNSYNLAAGTYIISLTDNREFNRSIKWLNSL